MTDSREDRFFETKRFSNDRISIIAQTCERRSEKQYGNGKYSNETINNGKNRCREDNENDENRYERSHHPCLRSVFIRSLEKYRKQRKVYKRNENLSKSEYEQKKTIRVHFEKMRRVHQNSGYFFAVKIYPYPNT
uniref:Uncharacterized protein n=1 Tax=Pristionchus pacificus TaxID=54126 RepID=A0A2A6C2W9_PRIPA|eukprot:PDM72514.1 hypothetical protein PRIPAC_38948 [Pristionchus pacificus]